MNDAEYWEPILYVLMVAGVSYAALCALALAVLAVKSLFDRIKVRRRTDRWLMKKETTFGTDVKPTNIVELFDIQVVDREVAPPREDTQ